MNNIFNVKLFKEALRQLKIPSLIFLGIILGFVGITTFANISDAVYAFNIDNSIKNISAQSALLPLIIIFAIIIPIFTFKLFGFLTKRNACDFYHAIPHKRTCIFVSYTAAILCIAIGFTIIATTIPLAAYKLADQYISLNYSFAFNYIINMLTCMILVLGICLLSSSLTGTGFTNIIFAIGLLVGPRFIIAMTTAAMTGKLYSLLPLFPDFGIFSNNINLVFGQIASMINTATPNTAYLSSATVYTFILGIVYIIIALFTFNKRNSEQAENSIGSPVAQITIRLGLGFIFFYAAVISIFSNRYIEHDFIFYVEIAAYIFIAFCAMTVFEMLSTKKIKRVLNVLISMPVLALISLVFYGVLTFAENSILNYTPSTSDIEYIQCSNENYTGYDDYYNYLSTQVKLDDEKLIDMLTDNLKNQITAYKEYSNQENSRRYGFEEYYGKYNTVYIKFKNNSGTTERKILLNDTDYNKYLKLISENKDYQKIYKSFPKDYYFEFIDSLYTKEDVDRILSAYKKDLAKLSSEDIMLMLDNNYHPELEPFESFSIYATDYAYPLPMNVTINSKTTNAVNELNRFYVEKAKNNEKELVNIISAFNDMELHNNSNSYCQILLQIYNADTYQHIGYISFNEYTKNEFEYEESNYTETYGSYEKLKENFTSLLTDTSEPGKGKYLIKISCDNNLSSEYQSYNTVFFSDNEEVINYLNMDKVQEYID